MHLSTDSTRAQTGGFPNRRKTGRFPVREDVRYRVVLSRAHQVSGCGTTVDIGSNGILFTTEDKLPIGRPVELSVNWPARLDGVCPLQFVATGRVVRSEKHRAAVRIERYEFKTRSTVTIAAAAYE